MAVQEIKKKKSIFQNEDDDMIFFEFVGRWRPTSTRILYFSPFNSWQFLAAFHVYTYRLIDDHHMLYVRCLLIFSCVYSNILLFISKNFEIL